MKELTKETLADLLQQFPSFECLSDGIPELLTPSYGVISGFQELLGEIEELRKIDLHEINPFPVSVSSINSTHDPDARPPHQQEVHHD